MTKEKSGKATRLGLMTGLAPAGTPRRGSLLYKNDLHLVFGAAAKTMLAAAAVACTALADEPYLADSLSVWFRADRGLSTNAVGGVTAWANQGTLGSAVDIAPHADNSAGHVAYEASGINGKPSLVFDGDVYLKTASEVDLGVTVNGGAWFVVFKTPCTRVERANMGIMGAARSSGQRFGAFFTNNGNEEYFSFFYGALNQMSTTSNATQIACAMCWKDGGTTQAYPMNKWSRGDIVTGGIAPGAAIFAVGTLPIPNATWVGNFKGEIAEVRVYNRPLTGRERSRIQFELCARYGVHWEAHGNIDDTALSWCENSEQLGYDEYEGGMPDVVVVEATAGGAGVRLDPAPDSSMTSRGYFTHNGENGLARTWYVAERYSIKTTKSLTLTFDRSALLIGEKPSLYYKATYGGAWTKKAAEAVEADGAVSFTLAPGNWENGFYSAFDDLDRSLSVWFRPDMGLTTNAVGGVTAWANQGTKGSAVDVMPNADNGAGHVAYEESGINGQPSLSFDGDVHLTTSSNVDLGMTADGGAWFVVFKTPCTRVERANMGIMGGQSTSGAYLSRFGAMLANNGNEQYFSYFNGDLGVMDTTSNATQIACGMRWKENGTTRAYPMNKWALGKVVDLSSGPSRVVFAVGSLFVPNATWVNNFKGEIAEVRVYSRPLTGRERSEVQFELCSRYGVTWKGHGEVDDAALAWHENGAQFGYYANEGLPEDVVMSAEAGGATLALDAAPAASAYSRGYLAHNGGDGFERVWYVSAAAAARALPVTLTVDADGFGSRGVTLRRSSSLGGGMKRVGSCNEPVDGKYVFSFPANGWQNGFYSLEERKGFVLDVH